MTAQAEFGQVAGLSIDPALPQPLYRQLYDEVRRSILGGRLSPGTRLPSTRSLAGELGVSRNTVLNAFEQLIAEGYLEGQIGSGTYVARVLPEDLLAVRATRPPASPAPGSDRTVLSERGARWVADRLPASPGWSQPRAFRTGLPALDAFPADEWRRLLNRCWRRGPAALLAYGHPAGYWPLREMIAAYVSAARAVRCDPDQVIVVSGSQHALDLTARLLLDPGDPVWMEDPGYAGARGALQGSGATISPVPLDAEGLNLAAAQSRGPAARLIYVTPSHQYPLGITMSLPRRLAPLEWAARQDAWVIEDDYDSEYRYSGRPLAALQGLDRAGRVIYLGTFSKVLFPSLRLGYLIVPPDLVDPFGAARALSDRHSPLIEQAVLAEFIAEGHFGRHIRRTRALYAERQAVLVAAAQRELAGLLDVRPSGAGMHLTARLLVNLSDREASRRAAAAGVEAAPLSSFAMQKPPFDGLVLGYAGLDDVEIRTGTQTLRQALSRR